MDGSAGDGLVSKGSFVLGRVDDLLELLLVLRTLEAERGGGGREGCQPERWELDCWEQGGLTSRRIPWCVCVCAGRGVKGKGWSLEGLERDGNGGRRGQKRELSSASCSSLPPTEYDMHLEQEVRTDER